MRFKVNRFLKNIPIIYDIYKKYLEIIDSFYYKKHCSNYKIIALGGYCLPRVITTLSRLKPRKFYGEKTCFFDLCFSLDLKSNIKLLENQFEDIFDDVEFIKEKNMWANKKYNITFNHEYKESFEVVKKNFEPRIKNLFEYINDKSKHLYFIIAIAHEMEKYMSFNKENFTKLNDDDILNLINVLQKYRNKDDFDIIIINQTNKEYKTNLKRVHIIDLVEDKDFSIINQKGDWVGELKKQKTKEAKRFYKNLSKQLKNIIQPKRKLKDIPRFHFKLLFFKICFQNPLYLHKIKKINKKYEIKNSKEITPIVISKEKTIEELISSNKSIARFGDGEFALIEKCDLGFQKADNNLRNKLKEILENKQENLLVAIPNIFASLDEFTKENSSYWRKLITLKRKNYYDLLNLSSKYYDAFISRPYIAYKNKKSTKNHYENIKKLWDNKDIVIVEGEFSRMGVGNDLYKNAKSIKRILCPAYCAYSKYDEILNFCKTLPKNNLFILALGPTATILAYDLAKMGYRALDLGNLDIEYEWFLKGAKKKIAIKNKFVWEALNGTNVSSLADGEYEKQIITKILLDER